MKVALVHPGADLPSSRIRMLQLAPHLAERGVSCEAFHWTKPLTERRAVARQLDSFDAVVFHYRLPSLGDQWLLRRLRPPLIFDFDDALPYRHVPKNGSHRSVSRRAKFARMLRLADAFACGNRYLESLTSPSGKPTAILPSPVPVDVPQRERSASPNEAPLRIGWVGGRGNLPALDVLHAPLAELARTHDLRLVLISDASLDVPGVQVEHVPWTLEGQEAELARLDVGVMPLADNPWTRGKCAYKLLQYMAAGVPSVASPVGMNADLIEDGANGLLAKDPADWTAALGRLADDPELGHALGTAGRATVEAGYGYGVVADRWCAFLERLVRG